MYDLHVVYVFCKHPLKLLLQNLKHSVTRTYETNAIPAENVDKLLNTEYEIQGFSQAAVNKCILQVCRIII